MLDCCELRSWLASFRYHHQATFCRRAQLTIQGTQVDLREDQGHLEKLARQKQRPISTEQGERLARELGAVKYVECSALTQRGLKNVFDEVSRSRFLPTYRTDNQAIVAALEPPVVKKKNKCLIL